MNLYLVQHGEAKAAAEDPQRPLTAKGEMEVRKAAETAASLDLRPAIILHSGKLRAEQTARILGEALGRVPEKGEGLAPNDDPRPWAERIRQGQEEIMIVGHLPFLERLASLLISGDENLKPLLFAFGAINCLVQKEDGKWAVRWILTPEMADPLRRGN